MNWLTIHIIFRMICTDKISLQLLCHFFCDLIWTICHLCAAMMFVSFFFKEKTYMSRINLSILKSNDMCCHTGRSRFNLWTVKYRSRQESNMMLLYWCSHVNPNFFLYVNIIWDCGTKEEEKEWNEGFWYRFEYRLIIYVCEMY